MTEDLILEYLFQRFSIFHKFVYELNRIARLASDGVRERVKKELHFYFYFSAGVLG